MMNSFDEILSSLLNIVEENPSADIDALLASKLSELGLSDKGMKTLSETNSFLEAYDEMYRKLQESKDDGDTRDAWVQDMLIEIADKHNLTDEQKESFFADIAAACEKGLTTTISEGE